MMKQLHEKLEEQSHGALVSLMALSGGNAGQSEGKGQFSVATKDIDNFQSLTVPDGMIAAMFGLQIIVPGPIIIFGKI
jgi:hypothetical protein